MPAGMSIAEKTNCSGPSIEEKVDRAARDKVRSQKREIPEGSEEWDLLQKRYYAEELKKFGIDLAR